MPTIPSHTDIETTPFIIKYTERMVAEYRDIVHLMQRVCTEMSTEDALSALKQIRLRLKFFPFADRELEECEKLIAAFKTL